MKITVIEPQTPEEFKQYYSLRYEILRKPWGQPKGSERDEGEEASIHRMIIDKKTGNVLAGGRLQINFREKAWEASSYQFWRMLPGERVFSG